MISVDNTKKFFELAQDFHLSAKVLLDADLSYTFFSAGFLLKRSLECFFKACNLFCNPEVCPEEKKFKTHNLMKIIKELKWLKFQRKTEILIGYFNTLEYLNYNYNVAILLTPHLLYVWDVILKEVVYQMPNELHEAFQKLHFSPCDLKYQDGVLLHVLIETIENDSNAGKIRKETINE